MNPETKRNFVIGGGILAAILVLAISSLWNKEPVCGADSDTVVALVDFTDPVGADALASLKNSVWSAVERASAGTSIILRPIVGIDRPGGKRIAARELSLCRPAAPSLTDAANGSVKRPHEAWKKFKDQVCGDSPTGLASEDDTLACSDPRRGKSFFEQDLPISHSSPIVEEITDTIRRYLTPNVKHWQLIVASDWREYNPPKFDLEYHKCEPQTDPHKVAQLPLIGQTEKLLKGSGDPQHNNEVDGFLILRSDMTPVEADCLALVEDEFFRDSVADPPPELSFQRLSVTQR